MFEAHHHSYLTLGSTLVLVALAYGCGFARSARTAVPSEGTRVKSDATQTNQPDRSIGKNNPDCPVVVNLIKTSPSKPPLKFYSFKLRLMNRQAEPRWFVFRYRDPLPESGRFDCYSDEKHCFSSNQFTKAGGEEKGSVIVVNFLGHDTFTAIRLPAGGDIALGHYFISTASPVSDFEIWEVDSLLVNAKTPVEQWLPYPVLSDQSVHLGEREKMTVLDWDKKLGDYRRDYPDEKVEFVTAHAIRKWLAPLTRSTKKQ